MSVERLREHLLLRYVVAVGAAVATIAALIPLRFLIEPLPSPPFLLTVMIVAWVAGFGPANIAVVISAVALDYWFVPPLGAVATTWHEIASVISFAVVGIGVAWLTATRRQAEDDRKALLARERASRASAEAANRAKDEFVAMLGHEFRNPLSAIVNAVHILERPAAPEETTRHAREVIARQAKNITRMVEDLLEINRIATGKIRLDPQPMELAETVRRCLATLTGRTGGHRVALDADEVWVDADPVRLEQIVVNLLDNAVKYTPAGGAIQVRVSREGGHGVLRVRDTGVGIARDVLPRIFELFVQGEPGAIRGRSGLGIGLAVVQRLAELHGGTIDAASDGPGRGSTFSLRLRGVASPAVRTLRVRPVIAPGTAPAHRRRRDRPGPPRNPARAARDVGSRRERGDGWPGGVRGGAPRAARRDAHRRGPRRLRRVRARAAPAHDARGQVHAARRAHRLGARGRRRARARGRVRSSRDQAARSRRAGRDPQAVRRAR